MQSDLHFRKNAILVTETLTVFVLISFLACTLHRWPLRDMLRYGLYAPLLLFQGLWFYRFYIVGHEAAHGKLFPGNRLLNDAWGSIVLLPLMVPITIYRKIHLFHHGFNRHDDHTSALDTFVFKKPPGLLVRIGCYAMWYLAVFCGGFFLHSLVSVVLFLFIPPSLSQRVSPAFKGWTLQDQVRSIGLFLLGVGLHAGTWLLFGRTAYLLVLGYPMLAFAWVLSLLVYIFHYDTTVGENVRYNVRSVEQVPVMSWILMNFNEHATHHQNPAIPWYNLPRQRKELPAPFALSNQQTNKFFMAILRQLKGPRIRYENTHPKSAS